jgi:hypothetical protein
MIKWFRKLWFNIKKVFNRVFKPMPYFNLDLIKDGDLTEREKEFVIFIQTIEVKLDLMNNVIAAVAQSFGVILDENKSVKANVAAILNAINEQNQKIAAIDSRIVKSTVNSLFKKHWVVTVLVSTAWTLIVYWGLKLIFG